MASRQITVSIHVAWWLRYYMLGLVLMHRLTGMEINEQRVGYWLSKAIKAKVA